MPINLVDMTILLCLWISSFASLVFVLLVVFDEEMGSLGFRILDFKMVCQGLGFEGRRSGWSLAIGVMDGFGFGVAAGLVRV